MAHKSLNTLDRLSCEQCIIIASLRYRAATLTEKANHRRHHGLTQIADTLQRNADLNNRIADAWDRNHPEHSTAN